MIYAILEASGKQIWVKPGKFYDIDRIPAQPGEYIKLEKVLFINNNDILTIGYPCINDTYATGKILKHIRGRKITVFKMKPKKNMYAKNGHRQEMSRILIEAIKINTK
uniref:Large ribosomal subunit protein bL21c n=1 Tax=Helminthocladia australis TaxID=260093 RepID=A0A1G4NT60_9FLOR|nr:Ribosomal protein L21 [Helminthocladia australis]SCW21872.1 Ribosomal protein L21 [Helminthocladia australis]